MIEHKLPVSLVFGDRVLKQWILAKSLLKHHYSFYKRNGGKSNWTSRNLDFRVKIWVEGNLYFKICYFQNYCRVQWKRWTRHTVYKLLLGWKPNLLSIRLIAFAMTWRRTTGWASLWGSLELKQSSLFIIIFIIQKYPTLIILFWVC